MDTRWAAGRYIVGGIEWGCASGKGDAERAAEPGVILRKIDAVATQDTHTLALTTSSATYEQVRSCTASLTPLPHQCCC